MSTFLTFILWFLLGVACSYYATKRGRDPYAWFAIGIFFGIFGFIALFLLPPLNEENATIEKPEEIPVIVSPSPEQEFLTSQWFYINPTFPQQGPITFHALQDLWKTNAISNNTFVWSNGMKEWKKISDLPALEEKLNKV